MVSIIPVFAGQGVTQEGMGQEFLGDPATKEVFNTYFRQADHAARRFGQFPTIEQLCTMSVEEQKKPSHTHLLMYPLSIGALTAFGEEAKVQSLPVEIIATSGQSLGQKMAQVAAGRWTFEAGLPYVIQRGLLQDNWAHLYRAHVGPLDNEQFEMVAVLGVPLDQLENVAQQTATAITNINADTMINLAGEHRNMVPARDLINALGGKSKIVGLKVGAPFHHYRLMSGAAQAYAHVVADQQMARSFNHTNIPVISDLTGKAMESDEWSQHAGPHLRTPVRFRDATGTLAELAHEQNAHIIAFGGNDTATAAVANCFRGKAQVLQVYNPTSLQNTIATLRN
jgi:acyl transferase domain-containing protein